MSDTAPNAAASAAPRRAPPICGSLPLVGAFPQLLKQGLDFFVNARAQHGDIYTLNLGVTRAIALNHPRHAQHVMRDNVRNYTKEGPAYESIRSLVGYGLPASEGSFWLRQRRMIQPHFHKERLAGLFHIMKESIEASMERWERAAASGEPFNAGHDLSRITMDVVVKTLFGGDISPTEVEDVGRALEYAQRYVVFGAFARSLPSWMPVPGVSRYQGYVKAIDDIVFRIIARRRSANNAGGDLLGMLLDMVDSETGEQMTDRQLRDEAVSLFLAGHETTSMALSFACGLLMEHPDVTRALHQEVDTVLEGQQPSFAHLPKMRQLYMALQESMRLYPTSYFFPRVAVKDDEIDGFHIPAGTTVALMTYALQRHPECWDTPAQFDPQRFTPERSAGRHPLAWMPFGAGQRLCVGKEFALAEGQFIFASVLSRFEFEPVPGRAMQPAMGVTLRTRDGLWVRLKRRSRSSSTLAA